MTQSLILAQKPSSKVDSLNCGGNQAVYPLNDESTVESRKSFVARQNLRGK
jgi:hypothetical protein